MQNRYLYLTLQNGKSLMKKFLINALILCVIAIAISQLLFSTIFKNFEFPGRILSIVFIGLITCVFYVWFVSAFKKNPKSFFRVFMLQTTLKLFLYAIGVACYLCFLKQYAVAFLINVLVVYLIFTTFDVFSTLKFLKKNTSTVEK